MAIENHIQLIRGSTKANNKYVGLVGEITVDTTKHTLRIHDGKTAGGHDIANTIGTVNNAVNDANGDNIASTYVRLDGGKFTGAVDFTGLDYDGGEYVTVDTAKTNDNSKKVANTEWVAKADCVVHRTGDERIDGTKTFLKDIDGTALKAYWADLAENYVSDGDYPYGTLICFGGDQEITIATEKVNGVISKKPALLMNRECTNGLPVALAGRVDVLVKGTVNKFDNIVLSDTAGVGVVDNNASAEQVIGKALANKTSSEIDTVLCVTKFNIV